MKVKINANILIKGQHVEEGSIIEVDEKTWLDLKHNNRATPYKESDQEDDGDVKETTKPVIRKRGRRFTEDEE